MNLNKLKTHHVVIQIVSEYNPGSASIVQEPETGGPNISYIYIRNPQCLPVGQKHLLRPWFGPRYSVFYSFLRYRFYTGSTPPFLTSCKKSRAVTRYPMSSWVVSEAQRGETLIYLKKKRSYFYEAELSFSSSVPYCNTFMFGTWQSKINISQELYQLLTWIQLSRRTCHDGW